MKFFRPIVSILVLTFALTACEEPESKTMVLFEETMEIHDIAMEKSTGKLVFLSKDLRNRIDSLKNIEGDYEETISNYQSLVDELEIADDAMMEWMVNFTTERRHEDSEENRTYYADQKDKVIIVNQKIDDAMAAAEKALTN